MKILLKYLILFSALCATTSYGQISPGDLSAAHQQLEGMSNCTQCHELGEKVSNAKCLDCHKEIQSLIDQKKGYHSSKEVKAKDCFACHSEHHGRKFDMVRFDEKSFDHNLTGYKLEGQHKVIDCRDCHVPENIADAKIRKLDNTFLGLDDACLSCHDDYHQKTLSSDCISCHTMDAFTPASKFNHDDADFKLRNKHADVECISCHKKELSNGREMQLFANVAHNGCVDCHDDSHEGHFSNKCDDCHSDKSFNQFIGEKRFNHERTKFSLKGKHKSTACFTCHTQTSDPLRVFQDNLGIAENNCVKCHEDQHEGRFGLDCNKCHKESGFMDLKSMDSFDHNVTDFALIGKHIEVDCKKCHEASYSDPIDFSNCKNCHDDYHNGEFVNENQSADCVDCHSVDQGFDYSLFTIEMHAESKFPLEGAHIATPCFACHIDEEDDHWKFREIGLTCIECHENIHDDQFAVDGVTNCTRCHESTSWFPSGFDHSVTSFPLEGGHADVECKECHTPLEGNGKTRLQYKIEKFECIDCHQ